MISARTRIYFELASATIAAGLLLRLVPMGLPPRVVKWGGSVLWAAMVYWLLAGLMRRSPWIVGLAAGVVAGLVELSRLVHTPGLDAFRETMAGVLLLGRVFQGWHFAVYWGTIALVALMDAQIICRGFRRTE